MRALVLRLWNSPTVTSWGSRGAQSIRLFVVLPLILNRFNEVELAAWFLFGSIIFFSEVISMQTAMTFNDSIWTAIRIPRIVGACNLR